MAHSREKVRKSASARDSHARRICLKFPRESTRVRRRRSRVAREQQGPPRGLGKFRPRGAGRPRGSGPPRATTVFPAATLVKVSDYRKNVRTISPPLISPCLLFLNREGILDRFLLSPPRTDTHRSILSVVLTKANTTVRVAWSLFLLFSLFLFLSSNSFSALLLERIG